jgi:hypothetical protein
VTSEDAGEEYARLALAIDQHMPGYVDAYFGPPEWRDQVQQEGLRPLAELASRAATLASAVAGASAMDAQRRDFLARHIHAMQANLRLLQGEKMALADEVEELFDIRPTWVDEAVFEEAHRLLDELLPAGDSLRERMALRRRALEIPTQAGMELLPLMHQHLHNLTGRHFALPAGESLEFAFVQNKPWGAYNWYLGGGRSRIEINTDLPLHINGLAATVAHECYPGHHTELCIKDTGLVQHERRFEHSVVLVNAPSGVVSEGMAMCALEAVMPSEDWVAWHSAEVFPRAGLRLDAQRERAIDQAREDLDDAAGNAAFLLYDQGAASGEVSRYLQRYGLQTQQEAGKTIEFLSNPLFRSYIFTYAWGKRMLKALFAQKQETISWFARLLSEAVTPSQIRQWLVD